MILMRPWPWVPVVAAVAAFVLVPGCSSSGSRSSVDGAVSYDGQEVDQGGIAFIPEGGDSNQPRVRVTTEIVDGKYHLDSRRGPYPGKYRVEVYWFKKTGKRIPGERGHLKDETDQVLPPKYNDESELKVDVQSGANTLDFTLSK
jgi:hypothetical protein